MERQHSAFTAPSGDKHLYFIPQLRHSVSGGEEDRGHAFIFHQRETLGEKKKRKTVSGKKKKIMGQKEKRQAFIFHHTEIHI